ncbi:SRPBCC family protein [Mycobacterium sp.]|uniref:SRPBCC family protein n=1 Tax=Mycobacterium sp. TaxID=1785 RepID=UPI002D4C96BF|nr:SRPBCC family protein [Mycobacterium sp.]HZA09091.1 SRPBCC family protein [Mycobacterium sp.]
MSVTRDIATPPQRVWDVLADGWLYANWVVGASRIRAVDKDWPAPGTRICHSVGPWPLVINDETVSEDCVPLQQLVLRAGIWPVGEARITMRLTEIPGGCRVEMDEVAIGGPPKLLPTAVQHTAFAPRNRECLWRLANIAEHKQPSEV